MTNTTQHYDYTVLYSLVQPSVSCWSGLFYSATYWVNMMMRMHRYHLDSINTEYVSLTNVTLVLTVITFR